MENLQEKYNALIKRYNTLLDENEELKSILLQHGIVYPAKNITNESTFSSITFPPIKPSLDEKVALFRSFFKGREDVFARRWFSKTAEKGGYQPVCINEWYRGVCDETSAQNAGTETLLLWQTKTSIAIWREKMKMDVT